MQTLFQVVADVGVAGWDILLDSAVYILSGILIAGMIKVVLNPSTVLRHLGRGRYSSVVKAALFGVPLPL